MKSFIGPITLLYAKRISDGSIRQVIYLNERTKNELDELFESDEYLYIA